MKKWRIIKWAGKHNLEMKRWEHLSYPDKAQAYERNIYQKSKFGVTSPWLNIQVKPHFQADSVQIHGEFGKGSFLMVFRIKDEERDFTLMEENISSRARIILREFSGRTGTQFSFNQVKGKVEELADLATKAYSYWLQKFGGGT